MVAGGLNYRRKAQGPALLCAAAQEATHRAIGVPFSYVLKRNVGTVGRPALPCAVCRFSPSGHVLTARRDAEFVPLQDKGLCNVHAHGLPAQTVMSEEQIEHMRLEWLALQ